MTSAGEAFDNATEAGEEPYSAGPSSKTYDADDTASFFIPPTPSFKFQAHGDTAAGRIMFKEVRQQTNLDTGELKFWKQGQPMLQVVVHLDTGDISPEYPDDDGVRAIYIRGLMRGAVTNALRSQRVRDLEIGGWLMITYIGDQEPTRKGISGAKIFEAKYITAKDYAESQNG